MTRKHPLDSNEVTITMTYRFTTADRELTAEDVHQLLGNEPITEVLSLLGNGTGLEWREMRDKCNVTVESIETN